MNAQDVLRQANTLVIKIGTALIVDDAGKAVRADWLSALAEDIKQLQAQGKNVVIVSSGAVALGRNTLGIALSTPPGDIPLEKKQASSAIGQFTLFNGFHQAFGKQGLKLAQVLLTMSETENRRMHLNARATLEELLKAGIIPIINENDTISTAEIRFGDNDRLASRVAQMINADVVVLLSTADGLYTANPDTDERAEHIPVIENITDEHRNMAGDAIPGMSTGGMKSKLEAASAAIDSGISLIIANGINSGALKEILSQESARTTVFLAKNTSRNAKKRWIGAHLSPKGSLKIDKGAVDALKNGKSLLPVGITDVVGYFERGDVVRVLDQEGKEIAIGLSAYSSKDARMIMGQGQDHVHTLQGYVGRDEMIHRNDLVLGNK